MDFEKEIKNKIFSLEHLDMIPDEEYEQFKQEFGPDEEDLPEPDLEAAFAKMFGELSAERPEETTSPEDPLREVLEDAEKTAARTGFSTTEVLLGEILLALKRS